MLTRLLPLTLILALAAAIPAAAQEGSAPLGPDEALEAVVEDAIRERENDLREREAAIASQEQRVATMRRELEQLITRNEALRQELEVRTAEIDAANSEQMRRLVKVYEAMAPEEAAPILDTMRENVALSLFATMKGKAAAGIMEFMPTDKAARLGERLARLR